METLNALAMMNKAPLDMTLEALKATGRTQQADAIGLQEMMRKQQFEQAADPMRLQRMGTENDMGLQELHKARRMNKEADFSSDARMQAEYKGFLAKASDSDLAMATNKWQDMAFSDDPKIKAQGLAGMRMTKEFVMQKDKDAEAARRQAAALASAERVAKMGADARIAAGGARGSRGFDPKNPEHLYANYLVRAQEAETEEEAAQFRALAEQQLAVMREKWNTKGVAPGTIDPSQLGGGLPTVPTVAPASVAQPPGAKPAPTTTKSFTIDQLKARYPGVPEAKIREAAKAKGIEVK